MTRRVRTPASWDWCNGAAQYIDCYIQKQASSSSYLFNWLITFVRGACSFACRAVPGRHGSQGRECARRRRRGRGRRPRPQPLPAADLSARAGAGAAGLLLLHLLRQEILLLAGTRRPPERPQVRAQRGQARPRAGCRSARGPGRRARQCGRGGAEDGEGNGHCEVGLGTKLLVIAPDQGVAGGKQE